MKKWQAFMSYSSADSGFVEKLHDRLRDSGITLWFDREEILVGESIISKIKHGIDNSTLIVLFISRNWLNSNWCQKEMELMEHREMEDGNTMVLPFLIDRIPYSELTGFLRAKRVETLIKSNIKKSADIIKRAIQSHIVRVISKKSLKESDVESDNEDGESPIYLALDIPTGFYIHGAPSFWHEPPPEYSEEVQSIGQNIMFPILDSVADWWLHNQVGMWRIGEETETGKSEFMSHFSTRTGFFLVAPDDNPTDTHPLQDQVILLLVLHGCSKADSASLKDLEEKLIEAHVNKDLPVVRDNINVNVYAKGSDCMPLSTAIAMMIHMYSKKTKDSEAEFKIDFN